ncbi:MAG: hypothetical protein AABZ47_01630 [Planctomycetota bacterium]
MTRVNFIPEANQVAARLRGRAISWGVALAAAGTLATVPIVYHWLRQEQVSDLNEELARFQTDTEQIRRDIRALSVVDTSLRARLDRARSLRQKRTWTGVVERVVVALPENCWLASLGTEPATPPPPSNRPAPSTPPPANGPNQPADAAKQEPLDSPRKLRVAGFAPDAAHPYELVQNLKATTMFSKVTLNRSVREITAEGEFYRFDVECEW